VIRCVGAQCRGRICVNPLTVLKGYQQLVDDGLGREQASLGMFINTGARNLLLQGERQRFLPKNGPGPRNHSGGSPDTEELDAAAKRRSSSDGAQSKTASRSPAKEER